MLLGETIAPFRVMEPVLAVVPIEDRAILDAQEAARAGHRHLAAWMRNIEAKWLAHCEKRIDERPRMTLAQRIDYMRNLSKQIAITGSRVVYAKAGTLLAAALLEDVSVVVDHMAYWAAVRNLAEGRYLSAILNSEVIRARSAPMQAKGQGGARHFDNLVWELRIPEYARAEPLHCELADAAVEAERVAARAALPEGAYFTRRRRIIRDSLIADGIAKKIDVLVSRLLDGQD